VYEDLDVHRVNFIVPFFDADLVEQVMCTPLDKCVRHGFYHRWLHEFRSPCGTHPGRRTETTSLARSPSTDRQFRNGICGSRIRVGNAPQRASSSRPGERRLPKLLLSRNRVRLLYWHHLAGRRRYNYVADTVAAVVRHWNLSERKAVLARRMSLTE